MTGTVRHTRRHERKSLPLLVQYRFNPIGEFHTDYSLNISAGGLLLHMVSAPQIGATVHLQFIMRGESRVIQCRGRVLRVEQTQMPETPVRAGVQFVDIDEDDLEAINALVKQLQSEPVKKRASR